MPKTFAALGNTTRFAIVERLLQEEELSVRALLDVDDVTPPAISRHFKVLQKAGIVTQRVDKQRRLYSVRREAVKEIRDWTLSYKEFWQGSFDRLGAALDAGDII